MQDTLTTFIVSALIGILATLLTIFLTPALQQYFWMRKQREEIRLRTVDEINALLSEYITKHIDAANRGQRYDPPDVFFQSLRAAEVKLRVLFSRGTIEEYMRAQVMISHGGLGPGGTIEGFAVAHEAALHAMYEELGFFKGLMANFRRWCATVIHDAFPRRQK